MDAFDPSAERSVLLSTATAVGMSSCTCKQEFPRKDKEAEKHMKEAAAREGVLGVTLVHPARGPPLLLWAWLNPPSQL
jgi:hypothetical protein